MKHIAIYSLEITGYEVQSRFLRWRIAVLFLLFRYFLLSSARPRWNILTVILLSLFRDSASRRVIPSCPLPLTPRPVIFRALVIIGTETRRITDKPLFLNLFLFNSEHYSPVSILVRLILAPQWRKNDPSRLSHRLSSLKSPSDSYKLKKFVSSRVSRNPSIISKYTFK